MKVNEALNIPAEIWDNDDKFVDMVVKKDESTVASCLEDSGNYVKNDEFNVNNIELSLYERRLLAVGYLVGCEVVQTRIMNDPTSILSILNRLKSRLG